MGDVVILAFTAALNPTELAAITVMLLLPSPARLMFGYWLGAMLTGIACGLVIVFALEGTGAQHTTTHTFGPAVWLGIAAVFVLAALVLATGGGKRMRARRETRRERKRDDEKTPRWRKTLEEGNARAAFVVGVLLSFPGASYLAALDRLIHLHYSAVVAVLVVIGINVVQNLLLEIPMIAFRIWPEATPAAIDNAKAWVSRHGRRYGSWALGVLGVAVAIPSVIALLSQ